MNNNLSCNNDDTTQSRRNVRNTSTQTKARSCKCNDKKQITSTATQTFLTKDNIVVQQKVTTPACFVSFGTQTEDASAGVDHFHQLPPHENTNNTISPSSTVPTNLTATMSDLIVTILIAILKTTM